MASRPPKYRTRFRRKGRDLVANPMTSDWRPPAKTVADRRERWWLKHRPPTGG